MSFLKMLFPVLLMSFMMFCPISHANKLALITGASRGIGYALTEQFLEGGHNVIAVARNVEPLTRLLTKYPDKLQFISADLGTAEGQMAIAPAVGSNSIDYLVHNAGVLGPLGTGALLEASAEDIRNLIEVNLVAPILLNRQLSKNLKKGSRILMVSSVAGESMSSGFGLYCVSKAALDRYTESLQIDKPSGVLAASVHPGEVDTDMHAELRENDTPDIRLTDASTSARFLRWLLVDSSDTEFVEKKHNIYASDASLWNGGEIVEDPSKEAF
jgi:NAD(P)-dependent dehydrogenase (short-subunit alcohol dehydrogenase family)